MNERARAVEILRRIERESSYASPLLHPETPFVRTLVLGVLRWRSRLDFVIRHFAKRRVDDTVLYQLRVGVYQLLYTDVAPYAAVAETVALAPKYARGFVNAILRRVAEGKAPEPTDLATRTAHPDWLIARWIRNYGEEKAARIAEANQHLSYPDVFAEAQPPESEPSQLVPGMWKLKGSSAGVDGYALDEGSAVIADLAASTSRDILDLAAAPGGKTIVMRARGAYVISNDVSLARLRPLIGKSSKIVVSDGRTHPFRRQFDTVLLDAPCSATGTIRKNPELKWRLRESDIGALVPLQRALLASAMALAKSFVIYATCSLEPEENDDVVKDIEGFTLDRDVLRLTPDAGTDGYTCFVLRRL